MPDGRLKIGSNYLKIGSLYLRIGPSPALPEADLYSYQMVSLGRWSTMSGAGVVGAEFDLNVSNPGVPFTQVQLLGGLAVTIDRTFYVGYVASSVGTLDKISQANVVEWTKTYIQHPVVAARPSGGVAVAAHNGSNIDLYLYDAAGTQVATATTASNGAGDIAVAPDGNVYYSPANAGVGAVKKFNTSLALQWAATDVAGLFTVDADAANGRIWCLIADSSSTRIVRELNPSTGATLGNWNFTPGLGIMSTNGFTVYNNVIYIGVSQAGGNDYVIAHDPSGTELWRTQVPEPSFITLEARRPF